jgi:rubrerythrin
MIDYDNYKNNEDPDFYSQDFERISRFKKKKLKQKCQECGNLVKRKNQEVCDNCTRKLKYSY